MSSCPVVVEAEEKVRSHIGGNIAVYGDLRFPITLVIDWGGIKLP
jgi:hypothetical protein